MTEHQHTDASAPPGPPAGTDRHGRPDGYPGPDADPRLDERYLRVVPGTGDDGTVVLVGVVHDHPASRVRARRVVEKVTPAVVALELPPLAMPLYRQYAATNDQYAATNDQYAASDDQYAATNDRRRGDDSDGGPRDGHRYDGGEMAAALAAAGDARVEGIDAPNRAYCRRLMGALRSREPGREAARSAVRDTLSVTGYAITCAAAAAVRAVTPWSPAVGTPATHDSSGADPPAVQAADEARRLSRSRTLLGALELPPGQELVDELREASMTARLEALRDEGTVVAVVGHAHLGPISRRLGGGST